ncbi:hypothetical protein TRVL_10114 [Trypanosoma vivax]|nr:hypothetical protein TRVL_10114 [Trypanosoma vivax]
MIAHRHTWLSGCAASSCFKCDARARGRGIITVAVSAACAARACRSAFSPIATLHNSSAVTRHRCNSISRIDAASTHWELYPVALRESPISRQNAFFVERHPSKLQQVCCRQQGQLYLNPTHTTLVRGIAAKRHSGAPLLPHCPLSD